MRLGIFGGTFDPVHYGHLLLAESCREQCQLDEVWFVPAAVPPHKQGWVHTPAADRVAMLELAIAAYAPFRVNGLELERGGVSYTVETLRAIRQEDESRELFFLMGADSLHDLPLWKEPGEILRLAMPVIVRRGGVAAPDLGCLSGLVDAERLAAIERHQVEMPQVELSSRELRRRVAEGLSIRYRVPRAVEMFIEAEGLYRRQAAGAS
jgi:nicotinate-nucleotide adenylyltransferase